MPNTTPATVHVWEPDRGVRLVVGTHPDDHTGTPEGFAADRARMHYGHAIYFFPDLIEDVPAPSTGFTAGQRVTLLDGEDTGWNGLTATVTTGEPSLIANNIEVTLEPHQTRPDGYDRMTFHWPSKDLRPTAPLEEWERDLLGYNEPMVDAVTRAVVDGQQAHLTREREIVSELRAETASLEQVIRDLKAHITAVESNWNADRERIGSALASAAEEQSWCGDYEDAVERLNRSLNRELLCWRREREWEVTVTETLIRTVTVNVSGTTADEARASVENGNVELDFSRDYDPDSDWSIDGVEPA